MEEVPNVDHLRPDPEINAHVRGTPPPELQRRGLFRKEYAGPTLRENLGLRIPLAADWHAARRRASE